MNNDEQLNVKAKVEYDQIKKHQEDSVSLTIWEQLMWGLKISFKL